MQSIIQKIFQKKPRPLVEKRSAEGYDIWAKDYDQQPGNLMLDFDEKIFSLLLDRVDLTNKIVADIGCGTGRHWNKIFAKNSRSLQGFDVSLGMLQKLKQKFPEANVSQIREDSFLATGDSSFDVIISTLTVAHIKNIQQAIEAWCRILKPGGEIIITDFHPDALAIGGKRTFKNKDEVIFIINYIHPVETVKRIFLELGFTTVAEEERLIDDQVKHYYEQQNALHVYNRFKGVPMIYGLHLKQLNDFK